MQSFGPSTVGQIFDDARALTAAQSEGIAPLGRLEAIELARRSSSAKSRAKSRRMKAARVELTGRHKTDLAHHFGGSDSGFQHGLSARTQLLPYRQRRHPCAATGVHDRRFQSVIIVQAMSQGAVGQNGVGGAHL